MREFCKTGCVSCRERSSCVLCEASLGESAPHISRKHGTSSGNHKLTQLARRAFFQACLAGMGATFFRQLTQPVLHNSRILRFILNRKRGCLNTQITTQIAGMHANAVYLSLINDFFTIVNARGAAERRFLYNPLRQLRDEEPRSPSLRRAPEDAMPQHATAWAKREFPKLPHLARRAFSQACLAYFPGTPCPEANASGCKQIAHPALLLS